MYHDMLEVSQYPNLLSKAECDYIIELASDKIKEATVVGNNDEGYRTAESCWIDSDEVGLLDKIKIRVSSYSGLPVENQEKPHIVKYNVGGKYDKHTDWFNPNVEEHANHIGECGNRTHSFLIYLNEDFNGGETYFDVVDIKVNPKTGMGLMWNNSVGNYLLSESSHAGLPIIDGVKWILIIWVRENKY